VGKTYKASAGRASEVYRKMKYLLTVFSLLLSFGAMAVGTQWPDYPTTNGFAVLDTFMLGNGSTNLTITGGNLAKTLPITNTVNASSNSVYTNIVALLPSTTNLVLLSGSNGPPVAGGALVFVGTNANGSSVVKSTNWPSGGSLPSDSAGALTNNGSGTLGWLPLSSFSGGGSGNTSSNIPAWLWSHDSGNDIQVPLSFALWAWFGQNRYTILDSFVESTPNTNAAVMNSERFASYYGMNVPFGCDTNLGDFNPINIFGVFSNWPTPFVSGAGIDDGITKYRVRLQKAINENNKLTFFIDGQVNVLCDFMGVGPDANSSSSSTNLLQNGCNAIYYVGCVTNTGSAFNQYTSTNATRNLTNLFGRIPTNVPQYFFNDEFLTNVNFGVCPVTLPNSPVTVMNSTGPAYDEVAAACSVLGTNLGTTNTCFDWVQVTNYIAGDGANTMTLSATCNMYKPVWRTGGPAICSNLLYRAFTTVHSPNINPTAFQFVDLASSRLILNDLTTQTRVIVNGSAAFQGMFVQDNGTTKIGFMVDNSARGGILVGGTLYYPHDSGGTLTWTTTP